MRKKVSAIHLIVVIFLISLFLMACTAEVDVTIPVTLSNTSSSPYTIWIGHDTEISPSNEIPAGSSRSLSVTMKAKGPSSENIQDLRDTLKVNVAKDGKLITSDKLEISMPYISSMTLTVVWDGKSLSVK